MVKYHTDQDITIRCLEHRAYPIAVVQEMLKVEPKKNIINGILNVTPDGIQPPKSIMAMANALGYSNPEIDSKVYGAGEVSRIRRKLDPQQIMENTNVRGAMIPPRLSSQSKLEMEMAKRTKKLRKDLIEDSKVNRDLDIKERRKQAEENLLMSGEDYKNPGEKGFTFSVGMNTMTSLSQPSLFEPSKKERQKIIIKKATTAAGMAGGKIQETPEINEIFKLKKPRGRAPKGKVWDANRGQYVIDPYDVKAVADKTKKDAKEAEREAGMQRWRERGEMEKMESEDIVEALLSKDAAMSPASTNY
jgi:hypothetical protein